MLAQRFVESIDCESKIVIPATTIRATSATSSFRGALRRALGTPPGRGHESSLSSSEPELDNGQIGRGRYGWIGKSSSPSRSDLKIFVVHLTAARAGHRP